MIIDKCCFLTLFKSNTGTDTAALILLFFFLKWLRIYQGICVLKFCIFFLLLVHSPSFSVRITVAIDLSSPNNTLTVFLLPDDTYMFPLVSSVIPLMSTRSLFTGTDTAALILLFFFLKWLRIYQGICVLKFCIFFLLLVHCRNVQYFIEIVFRQPILY
jgi:hypothetical protein